MKIEINQKIEVDVIYLKVRAGVRYWEDAEVNGEEDTENGDNIPCKDGDNWCPIINLETKRITNWEQGKKADIHYTICDDGDYWLCDEALNEVYKYKGYYVPDILCPKDEGYGDYIIMEVDENGYIKDFNSDVTAFVEFE